MLRCRADAPVSVHGGSSKESKVTLSGRRLHRAHEDRGEEAADMVYSLKECEVSPPCRWMNAVFVDGRRGDSVLT